MNKKVWYAPNKFEAYGKEEIEAVTKCLEDGWLAGFGPKTIEFENRIAKMFGKKYGIMVNSGSSANLLAVALLNHRKSPFSANWEYNEIITPACTFSTTVAPIIQLGFKPVFVDVGLNDYVANIHQVIDKINKNTCAIMLPNLIGNKPNFKLLREHLESIGRDDILVIEDSCDTITLTEESDISTTSFYASHIITAGGSGGMIMVNDEKLRDRILQYRDWGRMGDNNEDMDNRFKYEIDGIPYDYKFLYDVLGYNFKSSEMNAAFGLVQLDKFGKNRDIRRQNFLQYKSGLTGVKEIILPNDHGIPQSWLAMPLLINPDNIKKTKEIYIGTPGYSMTTFGTVIVERADLLEFLEDNGIQTRVCFAGNITKHPAYTRYKQDFTNSDKIMANGFLLGCHHGMNEDDVRYVCDKIKEYFIS